MNPSSAQALIDNVKRANAKGNAHLFPPTGRGTATGAAAENLGSAAVPMRIRQSARPLMNRLETEFLAWMKVRYFDSLATPIRAQSKTYKIANGLRYSPDFTAILCNAALGVMRETAWEVKGKWVDGDSFPKLKMFAHEWPEIDVLLVWKDSQSVWQQQRVLP